MEAKRSQYWGEWLSAMHEELESLKAKGIYKEVESLPLNRKAIQCKWVLHIKHDKSGQIACFKAQLVVKGFTQIPGQDFTFTFTLVVRWDSIRTILCIAAIQNLELRQLDVKTAYLNAPLDKEIYIKALDGFNFKKPFWRLRKGLYGLCQAGRQWYLTLHCANTDLDFERCESNWSTYIRHTPTSLLISATSIDDILLASNSNSESDLMTRQLDQKFSITDSGDAEWILGCCIMRNRDTRLLMIDQEQFVTLILCEFGMENCNAVITPCPKRRLTTDMCPQTDADCDAASLLPYHAIVGKCMYLSTCTRPDISYAVWELARFMSNYGQPHFDAAKHLLRYLQGTRSCGIIYGDATQQTPLFRAFSDADWGMCETRRSILGYIVKCGGGPISWSSKQQPLVALSMSRTVTPEPRRHVTVGRSHDQTGSDPSRDPPRDQSRDQAPKPASNQSCDKEREHDLMHAYFCRCNLCYVHDRY